MYIAEAGANSVIMIVVWVVVIAAMMYFMSRPQKKEEKRRQALLASLEVGDTVLTSSGFYGVIIGIDEEGSTVVVEFGNNKNCRIPMQKAAIIEVEKADGSSALPEASAEDKKSKKKED